MRRDIKALKVGNSFIPSLTFVRRGKVWRICCFTAHISPHTFCCCQSIWRQFKERGRGCTVSKAAFHTAHIFFFTSSHLVFCLHGDGATGASETTNACRTLSDGQEEQQQFTELCSRLPSITSKCPRVAAPLWSVKPCEYSRPCFSCRKLCGRTSAGLLLQSAPTVYHYTRLASTRLFFFSEFFL